MTCTATLYKLKPNDGGLIAEAADLTGTDCNCPIACDEVIYSQACTFSQ